MAQVAKIDSNITGLAYAREAELGYLPGENGNAGSPEWYSLNPNSYSDFGSDITTVAPNPINPSRQRRKGVITDLEASGGINHYMTFNNLTDLMQGVMFADIRRKGRQIVTNVDIDGANPDEYEVAATAGFIVGSLIKGTGFTNSANNALNIVTAITTNVSVEVLNGQLVAETPPATAMIDVIGYQSAATNFDVDVTGDFAAIVSAALDLTTLGIVPGQWVFVGGDAVGTRFVTAANNGFKRVRSITATRLTFDKSYAAMVNETGTGLTIRLFFGDVLRNETGNLIKRRSYQLERTLGVPDTSNPSQVQTEVLIGAVPNEFTLNVPSAELVTVDLTFMATDNDQRTATDGPKQTSVKTFPVASEFNTSSDIGRIRMGIVSETSEFSSALFAYVTDATISINNNVIPNKAVGVLGAFDVTAGTFMVSGEMTAYFSNIEAVQAVRNNSDVTVDISFIKDNIGIVFDLPLISLGNGRLNVELDQPITLPLSTDAASGEDILSTLNHTVLITYFNYLPTVAM